MTAGLRVLMVVFNATGRGTYWRAYHLGHALALRGHHVTLVAMSPTSRFRLRSYPSQGVNIVETPDLFWGSLRSGWDPWDTLRRILYVNGCTCDVAHVFESRPTVVFPAMWLKRRGVPLVMDWGDWFGRGGSVEERPNPVIRTLLRPVETFFEEFYRPHADGSVVICSTLYHKAASLGIDPATILCLRDGSNTEAIKPQDRDEARRALGIPQQVQVVGYVGAISYRDAMLMAESFNLLHAAQPSARLLLIGYVNAPLKTMVAAPGAVIQTGVLDYSQINTWLAACDVCWLPYVNSGANQGRWPMKLNDYMAAGRPTVATAVGDVPEAFERYEVGVLTRCSPEDLASQALALLSDPQRCIQLGQNARRAALEAFSWHTHAGILEAFYKRTIAASQVMTTNMKQP